MFPKHRFYLRDKILNHVKERCVGTMGIIDGKIQLGKLFWGLKHAGAQY